MFTLPLAAVAVSDGVHRPMPMLTLAVGHNMLARIS